MRLLPKGVIKFDGQLQRKHPFNWGYLGRWGFFDPSGEIFTFDTEDAANMWFKAINWAEPRKFGHRAGKEYFKGEQENSENG